MKKPTKNEVLTVLEELVHDVQAVGREYVETEWPDLWVTFQNAQRLLRECGRITKQEKFAAGSVRAKDSAGNTIDGYSQRNDF